MNTDRRNLVKAIKIATYNAERWLARRFFKHYKDPRDWLTIFPSVLQLSGRVSVGGRLYPRKPPMACRLLRMNAIWPPFQAAPAPGSAPAYRKRIATLCRI